MSTLCHFGPHLTGVLITVKSSIAHPPPLYKPPFWSKNFIKPLLSLVPPPLPSPFSLQPKHETTDCITKPGTNSHAVFASFGDIFLVFLLKPKRHYTLSFKIWYRTKMSRRLIKCTTPHPPPPPPLYLRWFPVRTAQSPFMWVSQEGMLLAKIKAPGLACLLLHY